MKKTFHFFLVLCAVCLQNMVQAQSPSLLFPVATPVNATSSSLVNSTAVDAAGNIYVAGQFQGSVAFGSTTFVSDGYEDVFVAKYNSTGVLQWAKRAGGEGSDIGYGIAIGSNSVYITGVFGTIMNFNTPSATGSNEVAGVSDIFLAKYDDAGNFQWARRAGETAGIRTDRGNAIAVSGTDVFITGTFSNTIDFNTPSAPGTNEITSDNNSDDIFLAKYNSAGDFQWARRAGGSGTDEANGIAVSGSAIYVTGVFRGITNFNTPSAVGSNEITSAGGKDMFLAKYDVSGNFLWAKRAGGEGDDDGKSVSVSGNAIYVTGFFDGFYGAANFNNPTATGTNELNSAGANDVFLAQYDDAGNFQWAKRAGGTSGDIAYSVVASSNAAYIVGSFGGAANFNTPSAVGSNEITSAGGNDIFVAKYNGLGGFEWAQRGGGTGFLERGYGIALLGTSIYAVGSFVGTANFNTPSATGSNELTSLNEGGYLVRYEDAPAIGISASPSNTIVLGTSVTFTASSINGGTAPTYQWTKNGNNVGTNSPTYTDASLANNDVIACVMTSNNPTFLSVTATSNSITMVVTLPAPATSLHFDGTNDFVAITNTGLSAATGTVEFWQKSVLSNNLQMFIDAGGENFAVFSIGTTLYFRAGGGGASQFSTTFDPTVWNHIALVWNGSGTSFSGYLNGTLVSTATQGAASLTSGNVFLGKSNNGFFYNGSLEELRLWTRALPQCEIQHNINCELPSGQTGLWAYYKFNQGSGSLNNSTETTLTDASGNSRNGTLTNFTLTGATSNWITQSSITTGNSCAALPIVSVSIVANPNGSIVYGTSVTFTATPSNGGTTPQYQWKKNNVNVGTNSPTYTDANLNNNDVITCVLTPSSEICAAIATSNAITASVTIPQIAATALNFDGVNDYVNRSNNTGLSVAAGTIEFRQKGVQNSNVQMFIDLGGENFAVFSIGTTLYYRAGGPGASQFSTTFDPTTWNHIALVWNGSGTSFSGYLNGTLVGTGTQGASTITAGSFRLGRSTTANTYYYNGLLEEVRVWTRALPQCEIENNKNCELPSGQTGLWAYYKFNQGVDAADNTTITTLTDASGNFRHGTLLNFTLTSTTSNWTAQSNITTGNTCTPYALTWTGATSTDWSTATNWTPNCVPSNINNVIIPTTTNKPMLPTNQTIANLSLTGTNKIMLGSSNLIVNAITGGSSSSYVITDGTGALTIKNLGTNATLFPVGPSETVYAPVTITNNVNRDFTVKVGTTITNPIANYKYVNLQWDITPSVLTGNTATLALGWSSSSQASGFNPASAVQVNHYNGTAWDISTSATVTGSDPYLATATGISSFSPFSISNAAVLPVELLSLTGQNTEGGNLLTWETANEVNNKGFQVERLAPPTPSKGENWEVLGFKTANNKAGTYEFMDNAPLSTSYYRLRQIDNDGKETLSKVISIAATGKGKLKAYPNPVSNVLTIETTEISDYQIFNLLGQQVLNGKATQRIDVSALPEGTYFLKVGAEQVKFMKQ